MHPKIQYHACSTDGIIGFPLEATLNQWDVSNLKEAILWLEHLRFQNQQPFYQRRRKTNQPFFFGYSEQFFVPFPGYRLLDTIDNNFTLPDHYLLSKKIIFIATMVRYLLYVCNLIQSAPALFTARTVSLATCKHFMVLLIIQQ
jgi:hypothetical protein